MVRVHDRRERVLQRLKALHARLGAVAAAAERAGAGDVFVLRQVADRDLLHLAREVDEIAIVGHLVVVDLAGEAGTEGLGVLPGEAGTRAAEYRIVRQVLVAQLAGVGPLEVAEMVLQLEAAAHHVHGREGGVALGRDVPVIRDAELETARARLRVIRREQAALAPVFQREAGVREGENRVVEKAKPRMFGLSLVGIVVEVDLARLEEPVVLPRLASGEARGDQAILVLAEKFHALGAAARRPVALQEKARAFDDAGVLERVVLEARAEEAIDAALQPYPALRLELAELAVVAQELAKDRDVAALDLGRAARAHLEVAHALDLLRVDGGGIRLRRGAARGGKCDCQRREAGRHHRPGFF